MAKRLLKDKRVILFLSFLALFSLVLLASAVRDATFRPARHFSQEEIEGHSNSSRSRCIKSIAEIPLEKQIAFLVLLFLFGVLVASLLSPEMRKKLLRQFFRLTVSVILILYLLKLKPDLLAGLFPNLALGAGNLLLLRRKVLLRQFLSLRRFRAGFPFSLHLELYC